MLEMMELEYIMYLYSLSYSRISIASHVPAWVNMGLKEKLRYIMTSDLVLELLFC